MSKVPVGWLNTTFSNHIDLLNGFAFKSEQYTSNGDDIRLLRGDNIEPGALRWRNAKKWPFTDFLKLKRYQLQEGDFVIAMDRTWVSAGLKVAEVEIHDLPCLLVQRVSRIRAKETLVQSLLRQYFSGTKFENYVKAVQTETAVPHISSQQIKDFPLLLPPLPEQTKIAQILSTWDKAIATTEKLIGNSQQQKKALMQSLLTGKKRLPGFEGEWTETTLGEISKPQQWSTITSSQLTPAGFRVYGANGFIGYYSEYNHELECVTVTCRGSTCGEVSLIPGKSYITGNSMCLDDIEPSINAYRYIYYSLSYRGFDDVISGSAQPQIVGSAIKKIKVKLPPLQEQQKIAAVLTAADNEIELLQKKLAFLKQEKAALMQQLLTGKRRVKIDTTEECMDA
jgi:type I restriction enzyme S subunit